MKLPFVSRKKYEEIVSKMHYEVGNSLLKQDKINELKEDYMDLMEEIKNLKEDLKEKDNHIETLDKQVELAADFNDRVTNINCELVTKLATADKKIIDLEFCLEETKKENRNSVEIIKRTNIVKNLLINLTALKDNEGRILVEDKCILTHRKVEGNKVYEIARLLG